MPRAAEQVSEGEVAQASCLDASPADRSQHPSATLSSSRRGLRDDEPTEVVQTGTHPGYLLRNSARVPARRAHTDVPPRPPSVPSLGAYSQVFPQSLSDEAEANDAPAQPAAAQSPSARVEADATYEITASDRADYHFRAAEVLLERGYAREAVFEAQKGLRLCEPTPEQRALYAWLLYSRSGLKPPVDACIKEHLSQALAEDPQCERARFYMARIVRWR